MRDRKYLVTTLRRCGSCSLLFRAPTTSEKENELIYNRIYRENLTTDLPEALALEEMMNSGFAGTVKDYSRYLSVLTALGFQPPARVFDFGCSWGYGSFQLKRAGYSVHAFEISTARTAFAAKKLGVQIVDPWQAPSEVYDVFLSVHVIEHVPNVSKMIGLGLRLLKPGGVFVAFTPNGSDELRARKYDTWHHWWGFVHPQLIDGQYLRKTWGHAKLLATTSPYPLQDLNMNNGKPSRFLNLEGDELMFALTKSTS